MYYRFLIAIVIIIILLLIIAILSSVQSNSCNTRNIYNIRSIDDNQNADRIVALLELTGSGWTQHDNAVAIELSIMHPDVEVVNTESSEEITLMLLEQFYADGVRKFIGGSRSTMLTFIRPFIIEHPDIIFTTTGSTAVPLAKVDNIYRVVGPDTNMTTILPSFFARDGIISNDGAFEIIDKEELGGVELIYFLSQIGDEWTESMTEILVPAFNQANIQTAVTWVDINQSEQEIAAKLELEIPDLPERSIFMVFMAGNDNQKFYSSLQFAPKAKTRNHYAGDGTAFLTFEGEAIQQALDVNLRAYSYVPDSTPASVTLTEQTEAELGEFVHPFSVISVDVVQVLKQVSNNDAMLATLNNTYGITGSLASNADGDRITGQYIWFHYRIADEEMQNTNIAPIDQPVPVNVIGDVTWSPDFILGSSLQYGNYAGPFVTLDN